VETATYGSEFVAAHIAMEQVITFATHSDSMGVCYHLIYNPPFIFEKTSSRAGIPSSQVCCCSSISQVLPHQWKTESSRYHDQVFTLPSILAFCSAIVFWKGENQVTPA